MPSANRLAGLLVDRVVHDLVLHVELDYLFAIPIVWQLQKLTVLVLYFHFAVPSICELV